MCAAVVNYCSTGSGIQRTAIVSLHSAAVLLTDVLLEK